MKIAHKITIVVVLAAVLPLLVIGYYANIKSSEAIENGAIAEMERSVYEVAGKIQQFVEIAEDDVLFLANTPPVQGIARARDNNGHDPLGESTYQQWVDRLNLIFSNMGQRKPRYTQLRYLDESGKEMVRVDVNDSVVKVISGAQLQDKSRHAYFTEAMKLSRGQVYASKFNLNREHGKIELPYKPVLRFAVPVFDSAGKRRGIIVLNVLGEYLLKLIPEMASDESGFYAMVNEQGYYLQHPDGNRTWGFDLDRPDNLYSDFEGTEAIKTNANELGSFRQLQGNSLAYARIRPSSQNTNRYWAIFRVVPRDYLLAELGEFQQALYFLIVIVFILTVVMGVLLSRSWFVKPLGAVLTVLDRFAKGDLAARVSKPGEDEIGQVGHAFNTMAVAQQESWQREQALREKERQQMEELAKAADIRDRVEVLRRHIEKVAAGDLRELIKVEGTDDLAQLGKYLNDMTRSLARLARDNLEVAENISVTLSEVSSATGKQSSAATEQASATNQTSSTLEEIRQTSAQTLDKAQTLGQAAQRTREEGSQGLVAVEEAIEGIQTISGKVEDIAQTILALSEQTQQISEITEVVNGLAQQSKMLALNASIEAAKAGDAGKGFAVVADEVKDLAEQSQQSTAQVQKVLQDIRHATDRAVMATEEGSKGVNSGRLLVERSGDVMRALSEVIQDTVTSSQQIVAAVRQEAAGIDQVSTAMGEINKVTQQFVSSTKQTEQANADLLRLVEKLRESTSVYKV